MLLDLSDKTLLWLLLYEVLLRINIWQHKRLIPFNRSGERKTVWVGLIDEGVIECDASVSSGCLPLLDALQTALQLVFVLADLPCCGNASNFLLVLFFLL